MFACSQLHVTRYSYSCMVRSDHCREPGLVRTVKTADNSLFPRGSNWRLVQACAKATILQCVSRLQWAFAAEFFEVQTGEASVKTRFGYQTQTPPEIGQACGLHRTDDGGYQATLRSSENERISEGDPEKCIIAATHFRAMPRLVTR